MDVTDVLRDRTNEADGLRLMIGASVAIHVVLLVLFVVAPDAWIPARDAEPRSIMTITLGGGTPGPQAGGMTQIAGRTVQTEAPPEPPPRRPPPVRPPAAKPPEMTVPRADTPPVRRTPPAPPVAQAPPEARGTTPSQGEKVAAGSTVAETGARGQGFGLSTAGGAGSGVRLDVANFCCPEYIELMVTRVRSNWNARAEIPANVEVRATIQRDGLLTDIRIERTSGYQVLDLNALRALTTTKQLPELPAAFTNPTLTVYLTFEYTR